MFKLKVLEDEISINVSSPDDAAKIVSSDRALLNQLYTTMGMHHTLGTSGSPIDLIAALKNLGLDYEIIEGAEILDMPREELPEGAIP